MATRPWTDLTATRVLDQGSARERARQRSYFERVRRAEYAYSVALRKIARYVGDLVRQYDIGDESAARQVWAILEGYANRVLAPWARVAAARMIADVSRRDEQAWIKASQAMGVSLRQEIRGAPIGDVVRAIQESQVQLITSLPLEAARRVQTLTREYVEGGRRYDELAKMIMDTGSVTASRATLIARTEVAKAQSALTQARATYVGSTHYRWRSARDKDVRRMHKKLEGTIHAWNDPPVAEENGERHHPGSFPNCRCFAEPILPEVIQ